MYIIEEYVKTILTFAKMLPWVVTDLVVGWIIITVIVALTKRGMRLARVTKSLQGLIITSTRMVLWVVLIITIAQAIGLGGLAVALTGSAAVLAFFLSASVGPLLSNVFAGLFMVGDPDIKVGMRVTVNDGKTSGVIKGVDMRKIRIEDEKGLLHVVPNSAVENTEWIVLDRKTTKEK